MPSIPGPIADSLRPAPRRFRRRWPWRRRLAAARALLAAALAAGAGGACAQTYDLVIDNRTVRSLTLRVFSADEDGEFSQFPDRIFSLPPNREFRIEHAIARRGERRLFEFRAPDEELVDSFVMTYEEIEAANGRLTVPRGLAAIPRGTAPPPDFVDSSQYERIQYIPLFPEEEGAAAGADTSAETGPAR